jgi:hypothetical protein
MCILHVAESKDLDVTVLCLFNMEFKFCFHFAALESMIKFLSQALLEFLIPRPKISELPEHFFYYVQARNSLRVLLKKPFHLILEKPFCFQVSTSVDLLSGSLF